VRCKPLSFEAICPAGTNDIHVLYTSRERRTMQKKLNLGGVVSAKAGGSEFKASLGYIAKPCINL
jgi:hypothetical protein